MAEGGAGDAYSVVLAFEPAADVTIALSPVSQVSVTTTSMTFTPANWDVPQMDAVDDLAVEGFHVGIVTHTASSTDGDYNAIPTASVTANITDNDFPPPGITVSPTSGLITTEAGGTDSFTVVLDVQPKGQSLPRLWRSLPLTGARPRPSRSSGWTTA